jgi:polysaccharide deacetylase family protein (PEP-CTERM system associated)
MTVTQVSKPIKNVISVDVEDYFQVEAFASVIQHDRWDTYECRVEQNTCRILDLFAKYNVRATFFTLGWIAQRYPHLVRQIASAGHEVGSHGYGHQRLVRLKPEEFRADLRRANIYLTNETQQRIRCYRAPSFSIVKHTYWAFDILAEEGFDCDSSVFPIRHDLYGVPDAERFPHLLKTMNGRQIFEFPPSTVRMGNKNWPVGGGGYLRLFPYRVTSSALKRLNEVEGRPAMVYFHPWEIDTEQPRISASLRSTFRHYTNIPKMLGKIESLLGDFSFTTLSDACSQFEVDNRVAENSLVFAGRAGAGK